MPSRYWEPVPITTTTARLQRCYGTLVYIWFPLRLCPTTSRPHIWSSGRRWLSPSISSWLLSISGELQGESSRGKSRTEVDHGMNTSRRPFLFSLHALLWCDSSSARPKGRGGCQGSPSHAILVPHPTAY